MNPITRFNKSSISKFGMATLVSASASIPGPQKPNENIIQYSYKDNTVKIKLNEKDYILTGWRAEFVNSFITDTTLGVTAGGSLGGALGSIVGEKTANVSMIAGGVTGGMVGFGVAIPFALYNTAKYVMTKPQE